MVWSRGSWERSSERSRERSWELVSGDFFWVSWQCNKLKYEWHSLELIFGMIKVHSINCFLLIIFGIKIVEIAISNDNYCCVCMKCFWTLFCSGGGTSPRLLTGESIDGTPMHWQVRYTWWYTNALISEVHLMVHQCTDKWGTLDDTTMNWQWGTLDGTSNYWQIRRLTIEIPLMVLQVLTSEIPLIFLPKCTHK